MNPYHTNPDPSLWTGRISGNSEYLHEKVILQEQGEEHALGGGRNTFVLLGYACDEGVRRNSGRPGAFGGPEAIRKELGRMADHLSPQDRLIDFGDIHCPDGDLETAQGILAEWVSWIAGKGGLTLLLGGGHDISYGHFRGLRTALDPSKRLGIINFDSHFDLRTNEKGSHSGSPFYQISRDCQKEGSDFLYMCLGIRREANPRELFDRADALGVHYLELPQFSMHRFSEVQKSLARFLSRTDRVYVTVDMDGFSSAFSPGVSASCPSGFTPEIILQCLREIVISGKLLGIDVAESNPEYDRDGQTAKLAAGIIHYVIHEISLL